MTNGRIPRLPIDVFITKVGVDSRSARHAPRVCPVREDAERWCRCSRAPACDVRDRRPGGARWRGHRGLVVSSPGRRKAKASLRR